MIYFVYEIESMKMSTSLWNNYNNNFHVDVEDNFDEYEILLEEELVMNYIDTVLYGEHETGSCHKRKRTVYERCTDFWSTYWGSLISHPNVSNLKTREGKKFRRRFRLPFPVFEQLVDACETYEVFNSIRRSHIPTAAKVLSCLRILGRDSCADDINELSGNLIAESTANTIFKQFIEGIKRSLYPKVVQLAKGDEKKKIKTTYAKLGLPGCIGSLDCTRIKWCMCKKSKKWDATGKEGFTTVIFQVLVDHFRKVQYVSNYFLGSSNDTTVCENDTFTLYCDGALLNAMYVHPILI